LTVVEERLDALEEHVKRQVEFDVKATNSLVQVMAALTEIVARLEALSK
jgi:hypothetical protein